MTPEQLQILAAEITQPDYDFMPYEEIAAVLNYRPLTTEPNPVEQGTVPDLPTLEEVQTAVFAVDPAGLKEFIERVPAATLRLPDDIDKAHAGDYRGIQAQRILASMYLSADALTALDALLSRTKPDPAWSAVVTVALPSRASELGLPFVRSEHIQAALHLPENV